MQGAKLFASAPATTALLYRQVLVGRTDRDKDVQRRKAQKEVHLVQGAQQRLIIATAAATVRRQLRILQRLQRPPTGFNGNQRKADYVDMTQLASARRSAADSIRGSGRAPAVRQTAR